jgi:hypothetical protein
VACLYCGKDIGPFRFLKDAEFCSDVHRRRYGERLGKAISRVRDTASPLSATAGFHKRYTPVDSAQAPFFYGPYPPGRSFLPGQLPLPRPAPLSCVRLMPVPKAEAAWREARSAYCEAAALVEGACARSPVFSFVPAESEPVKAERIPVSCWRLWPPAAAPAARILETAGCVAPLAIAGPAPTAPLLPVLEKPELRGQPHAELPPAPVQMIVLPSAVTVPAAMRPAACAPRLPRVAEVISFPVAIASGAPAPCPQPAPVCCHTAPASSGELRPRIDIRLPGFAGGRLAEPRAAGWTDPLAPRAVECAPASEIAQPMPVGLVPRLALPRLVLPGDPEFAAAQFGNQPLVAARPGAQGPSSKVAVLRPVGSIRVTVPDARPTRPVPNMPQGAIIPVDFHCRRGAPKPVRRAEWVVPAIPLGLPAFRHTIAPDRPEDTPAAPKPPAKPERAEVVAMKETARRRRNNVVVLRAAQIAACLVAAAAIWLGARAFTDETTVASVDRALSGSEPAAPAPAVPAALPREAANRPPEAPSKGPLAGLRRVIADRAAAEVGDSLRNGMERWGASAAAWAPGWTRNPDGYSHVGDLALFGPSMKFTNYRLEFLGEIESKGMGWVVRAHDKQNYYAMKFKVVEAGLRPVIALVHYPVVGGRKGHAVETPLSVMVHNRTPLHIAVDVRGSRVSASVEGQNVDSWTDSLMASGGVGFFSEAGERARLYWMKVSKNQDWLGVVCSFIAGSSTAQTAELWGPAAPAGTSHPAPRAFTPDAVLAETDFGRRTARGPLTARITNRGRIRSWSC